MADMTSWMKITAATAVGSIVAWAAATSVPESRDPAPAPANSPEPTRPRPQAVETPDVRPVVYDRSHSPRERERPPTFAQLQTNPVPTVVIGGQVRRPGPLNLEPNATLVEAITETGGATPFGSLKRVRLIRDGRSGFHDLTDPAHQPVRLRSHDTIEVPQKNWLGR